MAGKNPIKALFQRVPKPFRNKYLLVAIVFSVWLVFLDRYNLIDIWHLENTKEEIIEKTQGYETSELEKELQELDNPEKLEEVAREKYYMKKDDEDVFVIEED
ncbi:MAG: septum formation initiator family protein [Bacteroidota bacterium]